MSDTGSDTNGNSPFEFMSEAESSNGNATPLTTSLSQQLESARIFKESLSFMNEVNESDFTKHSEVHVDLESGELGDDGSSSRKESIASVGSDEGPNPVKELITEQSVHDGLLLQPVAGNVLAAEEDQQSKSQPIAITAEQSPHESAPINSSSPKSPHKEEDSLLGWISNSKFLNKVASSAKSSVDGLITTLDPGMKEYLFSGGDVNIFIASDKEVKIAPVRDAFIDIFGRATVRGLPSQNASLAAQPVGCSFALKGAEERIQNLRVNRTIDVPQNSVVIAIENFLVEMTPNSWFDVGCLLLDDPYGVEPLTNTKLVTYTQATPIPSEYVEELRSNTPSSYPLSDSGFAVTIGQLMSEKLSVSPEHWHETFVGVSRRSLIYSAARALARLFKDKVSK